MMTYDVNLMLAFFGENDELMLRIEREYTVEGETPQIARQREVVKLTEVLCREREFNWSSVVFDITVTKKGKEIAA